MKMEEKLYDYMDWAEIEAVVYSEENHPRDILGPRVTEDGILIQAFFPGATRAAVHTIRDGKPRGFARMRRDFSLCCFQERKFRPIR